MKAQNSVLGEGPFAKPKKIHGPNVSRRCAAYGGAGGLGSEVGRANLGFDEPQRAAAGRSTLPAVFVSALLRVSSDFLGCADVLTC